MSQTSKTTQTIHTSEYLYGTDLLELKSKPYYLVLFTKIRLAKKLLEKLVKDDDMADRVRISKVYTAIGFNTNLLLELGYTIQEVGLIVSDSALIQNDDIADRVRISTGKKQEVSIE